MKSVEFCYWLQGLFEVGEPEALNAKQTDLIKRHLAMVFVHEIDASYPADEKAKLDAAHNGGPAISSSLAAELKSRPPGMRC